MNNFNNNKPNNIVINNTNLNLTGENCNLSNQIYNNKQFAQSRFSKFFQESNQNQIKNNKMNLNFNVNVYTGFNNINNYVNYFNNSNQNIINDTQINDKNNNNNSINIINSQDTTLTKILCTRDGLHKMKSFFDSNTHATDFITNIILLLNKENGLHIVFSNMYGNYFIQDIIPKMNSEQIILLLNSIFPHFVEIAENYSGTHCLQELMNQVSDPKMETIVLNAIKGKEIEMAYDGNATHVLQKILLVIIDTKRVDLNNIMIENIKDFSLHQNTIFVLKKFIATTTILENKKKICDIFSKYCIKISQNPFGNYAIQYLFEIWPLKDFEQVNKEIISKANILSCQRFSSNVVETALESFDEKHRNKLINRLCFDKNILYFIKNKYARFIITKCIKYMKDDKKKELENQLIHELKNANPKEYLKINKFIANLKLKKDDM